MSGFSFERIYQNPPVNMTGGFLNAKKIAQHLLQLNCQVADTGE